MRLTSGIGSVLLILVASSYTNSSEMASLPTNEWMYDDNRWHANCSGWANLPKPQLNFYTKDEYGNKDEGIAFSFKSKPKKDSVYKVVYSCTAEDEVSVYAFDEHYYYRSTDKYEGTVTVCVTDGKVQMLSNGLQLERVPRHNFQLKYRSIFAFNLSEY